MTRDEILAMARHAGLVTKNYDAGFMNRFTARLEAFAALVAAAEREECAALCDRFQARDVGMQPAECAAAIRARREKGTTA